MKGRTLVLLLGSGASLALAASIGLPILALSFAMQPSEPATPPLLQGATAGGGWSGEGCARDPSTMILGDKQVLSPELMARLAAAFPPGSDADAVQPALAVQGFRAMKACEDDPTVRRANFSQTGGSFPMTAVVYWKQSSQGQVEWTKGFVLYRGL